MRASCACRSAARVRAANARSLGVAKPGKPGDPTGDPVAGKMDDGVPYNDWGVCTSEGLSTLWLADRWRSC